MFWFFTVIIAAFTLLALLMFYTWKNGISPMPTSVKVKKALDTVLPDMDRKVVVDVGSGWGHLIFFLASKYQTCSVIGYENSPVPYLVSFLINQKKNLKIYKADFYDAPLDSADMVFCYLFPKAMKKLKKKFEKELQSGAYVISHTFAIHGWEPEVVLDVDDFYRSKIYLYRKG